MLLELIHNTENSNIIFMKNYIEILFGLEGKVALLTGAGGFLVGEMSHAVTGRAGFKQ